MFFHCINVLPQFVLLYEIRGRCLEIPTEIDTLFAHLFADKFTSFCVYFFSRKDVFNQTILNCLKIKCFETNI